MFNTNFKPETDSELKIPFFDDVSAADGWEGHTTSKSIDTLKSELSINLARLNCIVTGVLSGSYGDRLGYQIHFAIKLPEGGMAPSRLDIACLPVSPKRRRRGYGTDPRIEGTKKMALFMVNKALKGMFFFSVLAPGFIPFMSLMLDNKQRTLGQVWIEQGKLAALMPPKNTVFEEGEVVEAE